MRLLTRFIRVEREKRGRLVNSFFHNRWTRRERQHAVHGVQHAVHGVQHPLHRQSLRSLPAHTSLCSVLPLVQHPLHRQSLRSLPAHTSLCSVSPLVRTPSTGKACGASPLTPRFARFRRWFAPPPQAKPAEPPRSHLALLGFAAGSPPSTGKACGASPLTPRFARHCRA